MATLALFGGPARAGVLIYSQDFESPVGFSPIGLDVSVQLVNELYGNQPPGFSFAQQFTIETLLLTGTAAWGTGYSDPSGIGGNYALGMLSNVQNDLLGLSFDAQDYAYFNLQLDISSVDINGLGGPFVTAGSVPVFEFTLYDNPTGAIGLGSGTILDVQQATGTASAQNVLDWTNVILPLDASGSTNGNVTLRIDMLSGGYAALDNFLIVASDVAGDVSAVPEPTGVVILLCGFAVFGVRQFRIGRLRQQLCQLGIAGAVLLYAGSVNAGVIVGPGTVSGGQIYNWTNGSVSTGYQFTLADSFDSDDLITITATGFVDFFAAGGADHNAAGIWLEDSPPSVSTGDYIVRTDAVSGRPLINGAVTIWNSSLGAWSLFEPTADVGAGSSSPPTSISQTRVLSDVFTASGFTGLNAGDSFRLLALDSNTGNSGSWTLTLEFTEVSAVPEPSSVALLLAGALVLGYRRLRKNADTCNMRCAGRFSLSNRTALLRSSILSLVLLCSSGTTATAGVITFGTGGDAFTMEFVTIGDAGNAADTTGNPNPAGSVAYEFQIGRYEVTRGMIESANSESSLGIGLFDLSAYGGNDPDKPATGVNWYEAALFVNWLNTSTGHQAAYKFVDGQFELWQPGDVGYDALNPFRNQLANYVLPTTNEWYKAAFYDGSLGVYYDYATGSDVAPVSVLSGTASGTAVYGHSSSTGPTLVNLAGGESPYGTVGQSGNVYEWQENASDLVNDLATERRARSGGRYMSSGSDTTSSALGSLTPTSEFFSLGFRVASLSVAVTCPHFLYHEK